MSEKVNLEEKLALFDDLWSPKTVADLNDYAVHVVKVKGEFVWQSTKTPTTSSSSSAGG